MGMCFIFIFQDKAQFATSLTLLMQMKFCSMADFLVHIHTALNVHFRWVKLQQMLLSWVPLGPVCPTSTALFPQTRLVPSVRAQMLRWQAACAPGETDILSLWFNQKQLFGIPVRNEMFYSQSTCTVVMLKVICIVCSGVQAEVYVIFSVHELGGACIELVKAGGSCQAAPRDTFSQRDLSESARQVKEKVGVSACSYMKKDARVLISKQN